MAIKRNVRCGRCKGRGGVPTTDKNGGTKPCPVCKGTGLIKALKKLFNKLYYA